MGDRKDVRMDPKTQFSKKLARWTAVFWFAYMTWLSVIPVIQPAAALYAVYMGLIATVVMLLNVAAYTRNSIYEKSMLAMLDKTRMELTFGNRRRTDAARATDGNGEPGNAEDPYGSGEPEDGETEGGNG